MMVQLAGPPLARTPQVDVHYHYECAQAYALYPMVALQRDYSDTEALERRTTGTKTARARGAAVRGRRRSAGPRRFVAS